MLNLRVEDAVDVFSEVETIRQVLSTFVDVGLGYLTLGQSASTFSGGEAQRIRLASELCSARPEHTLFVLDEPTNGLHPADIANLLRVLHRLVAAGHSAVVIEHQLDVVSASDWVIDIGPECGADGGRLVFEGTPEQLLKTTGHTAIALRRRTLQRHD
jgi:excinuclease ABC subunit A